MPNMKTRLCGDAFSCLAAFGLHRTPTMCHLDTLLVSGGIFSLPTPSAQQRQGWGWAIMPILTKGSFFLVITLYINDNTHPLLPSHSPPLPSQHSTHLPAKHQNTSQCGTCFRVWLHLFHQNTMNVPIWAHWWCLAGSPTL